MQVKFSEDVIPLSDLKINPGKVVGRAPETHCPILLTSRGRGAGAYGCSRGQYRIVGGRQENVGYQVNGIEHRKVRS